MSYRTLYGRGVEPTQPMSAFGLNVTNGSGGGGGNGGNSGVGGAGRYGGPSPYSPPRRFPRNLSDSSILSNSWLGGGNTSLSYSTDNWDPYATPTPAAYHGHGHTAGGARYAENFARYATGYHASPYGPRGLGAGFRGGYPGWLGNPEAAAELMDDKGLEEILNNRAMLAAANAVGGTYPPRSNIRRSKMIYYLKFGEQGSSPGRFSEPSGVAITEAGELVVADTNNHRIQVFHPDGRFKFTFGECGKRDGQLLYPNRVAINRKTGDMVITERSPTHQIQIFNQYGQFLAKFGSNILQHPRGVCVDEEGKIIVVECKVMRVLIFEMGGALAGRFDCAEHLEFPNGVCVNVKKEIFISDNRAHAVKVFDYTGNLLRTIGGEGVTNFPIGVGINSLGQLVIADNHNNFNVTVFNQDGSLLFGQESRVKHAQCFDVALIADGSIALASKDYRLYLYRYAQPQPPAPSSSASSTADGFSLPLPMPPPPFPKDALNSIEEEETKEEQLQSEAGKGEKEKEDKENLLRFD